MAVYQHFTAQSTDFPTGPMARRVVGQELQVGANVASACTQDREGI